MELGEVVVSATGIEKGLSDCGVSDSLRMERDQFSK